MELGGLSWIRFVPEWAENRSRAEGERLSVEIRRLRTVDVLAINEEEDSVYAWRDEVLAEYLADPDIGPQLTEMPVRALSTLRELYRHTRSWRNFVFGGEEVTDVLRIFLEIGSDPVIAEIATALVSTRGLHGDELKNFVGRCAGLSSESDAPPVKGESPPPSVGIPQETSEQRLSGT